MLSLSPAIFIIALIAIVQSSRSTDSALVDVFLPVVLLVPAGIGFYLPHFTTLSCEQAVLIPIGIAGIVRGSHEWRFQRLDVWITLFVTAAVYTDYINLGLVTALFNFPMFPSGPLFAYLIGRFLIEQHGLRERFARRLVTVLAVVGLVSVVEFISRKDIFIIIARRVFLSDIPESPQMRAGFLRIRGPFGAAEEAGIVFLIGLLLSLWLWFATREQKKADDRRRFRFRRGSVVVLGTLLGLCLTLSRGPLLGAVLGFLIARIGMVRNRRLAVIVALMLGIIGGIFYNAKASKIAKMTEDEAFAAGETLQSAYYRTHLVSVYEPIAEAGGLFGWSATAYPRVPGLESIDNEYLLLWVTQGKVGLSLFILIVAETALAIVQAVRKSQNRLDSCFYYCLGAILCSILFVITTVWLTDQALVLFFVLVGWSQSLRDQYSKEEVTPEGIVTRFSFRRVFA